MVSALKLTYKWKCVIITSQKMTRNPNSLQGKTREYAQDSRTMKNKSSQNALLTTSQKHPVLAFSCNSEKDHRSSPPRNHSCSALGKLVRVPAALNHPLPFPPFFFCTAVFNFLSLGFLKEHLFYSQDSQVLWLYNSLSQSQRMFEKPKPSKEN